MVSVLILTINVAFGLRPCSEIIEAICEVLAAIPHVNPMLHLGDPKLRTINKRNTIIYQVALARVARVQIGLCEETVMTDPPLEELVYPVLSLPRT
ncbi:MAG TPA: hypothetical protein DCY33_09035 [Gemmatimonadetes bacterium]|nr:hypothetical protein [Gemmatimonadota bacterium]